MLVSKTRAFLLRNSPQASFQRTVKVRWTRELGEALQPYGSVYVWNFSTGKLLSQLTDAGYVQDVRFGPDGRYLLSGSADNTAILWLWKTEDLRDEACKRLSRNLLSNEWEHYLGNWPYQKTHPNLPAGD